MWKDFWIEWEGGESVAWTRCEDLMPCCINTCLQRGLLFDILEEAERTDTWFVDFVLIWMFNFYWSTDFQSPGSKRHWDLGGPEGTAALSGPLAIFWSVFCKGEPPLCPHSSAGLSPYLLSLIPFLLWNKINAKGCVYFLLFVKLRFEA